MVVKRARWSRWYAVLIILGVVLITTVLVLTITAMRDIRRSAQKPTTVAATVQPPPTVPRLKTEVIASGLSHPWEVAFLPDESLLVSERAGAIRRKTPAGNLQQFLIVPDVRAVGEGGLMGLAIDSDFSANRYVYTCYNSLSGDIRLTRWQVSANNQTATQPTQLVTGIPANGSGRHSGCRLKMDAQGVLWVGTGDAAQARNPQDPKSLGGKILRITRDGEAAKGNLGAPFDARVFSYGHRNTQGIALLPVPQNGVAGLSVEHGSDVDDEVNRLVAGNFGWNPLPPYNEAVPMTDKVEFPNAIDAIWSSGEVTFAPSGATFVSGKKWRAWDGALAVAVLKAQQLRLQTYSDDFKLQTETIVLDKQFGRLRAAALGPEDSLYITTDNGSDDKIIRVTPQ